MNDQGEMKEKDTVTCSFNLCDFEYSGAYNPKLVTKQATNNDQKHLESYDENKIVTKFVFSIVGEKKIGLLLERLDVMADKR